MSEPFITTNSKPESRGELNADPQQDPTSNHGSDHAGSDCEVSKLGGEVKQRLNTSSDQAEKMHAVPIHRRPDLLVPCADLVNTEWQRSQAARVHSLQKSCPDFPVCLVLLQGHKETERLLGHARLSRVVGHTSSLFVESVVVSKAERGKGYGRTLMEEVERYAKGRRFKRLCLTTHDKQHFYAHLGYVLSTPVQNAGAMTTFVPMETLLKFSRMPREDRNTQGETRTTMEAGVPLGPPPPCHLLPPPNSIPPPPPPPNSIPPPPPPPPNSLPPPPPPNSIPPPPPPPPNSIPPPPPPPPNSLPPPPPPPNSIPPPPPPPPNSLPPPPPPPNSLPPPPPPPNSIPPPPPPPPPPNSIPPLPPPPNSLPPPPNSTPPPPPPPNSIPPPPSILSPPPAGLPVVQTLTETPYRDAKGVPIFWMHKDI